MPDDLNGVLESRSLKAGALIRQGSKKPSGEIRGLFCNIKNQKE